MTFGYYGVTIEGKLREYRSEPVYDSEGKILLYTQHTIVIEAEKKDDPGTVEDK